MASVEALLGVLLLASHALGQPNCTGVENFQACLGNTAEFCPTNISCLCRNEAPFCRCDYFREGWKDYWYMGPKCNHLWNTLDFILVATVPAVTLVIIVTVIFSSFYCCKSEKPGRKQPNLPSLEAQHNPAFVADTATHLEHRDPWPAQLPDPQHQVQDDRGRPFPKAVLRSPDFEDVSVPNQRGNYSPLYSQPLRAPGPAPEHFSPPWPKRERFDYPSRNLPYPHYAEGRHYQKY